MNNMNGYNVNDEYGKYSIQQHLRSRNYSLRIPVLRTNTFRQDPVVEMLPKYSQVYISNFNYIHCAPCQ